MKSRVDRKFDFKLFFIYLFLKLKILLLYYITL